MVIMLMWIEHVYTGEEAEVRERKKLSHAASMCEQIWDSKTDVSNSREPSLLTEHSFLKCDLQTICIRIMGREFQVCILASFLGDS